LTRTERQAFIDAARRASPNIETFCLTSAYTGARILGVLALVPLRIDRSANTIVIESLKKRKRRIYRSVPVPADLLIRLNEIHGINQIR
jgi:integrase/recombinase XerD